MDPVARSISARAASTDQWRSSTNDASSRSRCVPHHRRRGRLPYRMPRRWRSPPDPHYNSQVDIQGNRDRSEPHHIETRRSHRLIGSTAGAETADLACPEARDRRIPSRIPSTRRTRRDWPDSAARNRPCSCGLDGCRSPAKVERGVAGATCSRVRTRSGAPQKPQVRGPAANTWGFVVFAASVPLRPFGSPGVSASNRNADGSMRAWVVRWLSSSLARCCEMATVRAPASVFGGWRMKPAESVWTSDCSTVTVGGVAERSRCRRARPRHSPLRSPAKAASSTIARNLGSMASARAKTSSTEGIVRGLDRSTDAPLIWHGFLAINRSSTAP